MTTSTTRPNGENEIVDKPPSVGGALADGLTLVRLVIGPIVAICIVAGWPATQWAILASVLFAFGALTDLFDDLVGGSQGAPARVFGWFDDAADAVLIGAALLAMLYVTNKAGILGWVFAAPALTYIARDILVGLVKGYQFSANGAPQSKLGDIKSGLAMLGVSLMIAAPWLQQLVDRFRARNDEAVYQVYEQASPYVWQAGQIILWIAAILAVITAVQYMFQKPAASGEL